MEVGHTISGCKTAEDTGVVDGVWCGDIDDLEIHFGGVSPLVATKLHSHFSLRGDAIMPATSHPNEGTLRNSSSEEFDPSDDTATRACEDNSCSSDSDGSTVGSDLHQHFGEVSVTESDTHADTETNESLESSAESESSSTSDTSDISDCDNASIERDSELPVDSSSINENSDIMHTSTLSTILEWICIALSKLCHYHQLSKRALLAILGLISTILFLISHPLYEIFPTSLQCFYSTMKYTKMKKVMYVVCPDAACNQLYQIGDAQHHRSCTNVIFGKLCGKELGYKRHLSFSREKWTPFKTFHFVPPSVWLQQMFKNKQFCALLKQHRHNSDGLLLDVYDGKLWKEFQSNPLNPSESLLSNSNNISLLLNVDWFKPFKRSEYKVSAIMMSVLNLPRTERFKHKWTMVLGVLPGPFEPKGHINTFLKPIVDDLLLLWDGLPLHPDGSIVKALLLGVSADMPALRKVTQFLGHKADLGCTYCTFQAKREEGSRGASGKMSYYTSSVSAKRNMDQIKVQAREYQCARTITEARVIQKRNGVRYTELFCLPYFDSTRMAITDPMHTFLLGMVHNEVKLCLSSLSTQSQVEFYSRLKKIKVPYDIGRLPTSIVDKESLSALTAQQWKNFACIYARPCFADLLPSQSYKSICLLCRIIELVIKQCISTDDVALLYRLLNAHHKQFYSVHGKWAVTVNYHIALHLPDIIADYGPSHGYWCFPYERMNGHLTDLSSNKKNIEAQLLNKCLEEICLGGLEICEPSLIADTNFEIPSSLKSIVLPSKFDDDLLSSYKFVRLLMEPPEHPWEFQCKIDRGDVSDWPAKFHRPSSYVKINHDFHDQLKEFFKNLYDDNTEVYVKPAIHKFGRCFVNGQMYSSDYNCTDRGSLVKAMFVLKETNDLHPYFGYVRFFFQVHIKVKSNRNGIANECTREAPLAYVTWMNFTSPEKSSANDLYMVKNTYYEKDRIISPRRFINRCALAPITGKSYNYIAQLP